MSADIKRKYKIDRELASLRGKVGNLVASAKRLRARERTLIEENETLKAELKTSSVQQAALESEIARLELKMKSMKALMNEAYGGTNHSIACNGQLIAPTMAQGLQLQNALSLKDFMNNMIAERKNAAARDRHIVRASAFGVSDKYVCHSGVLNSVNRRFIVKQALRMAVESAKLRLDELNELTLTDEQVERLLTTSPAGLSYGGQTANAHSSSVEIHLSLKQAG